MLAEDPDITGGELAHRLHMSPRSGLGDRLLQELRGTADAATPAEIREGPPDVRRRLQVRSALVSATCALTLTDDFEEGLRTLIVEFVERVGGNADNTDRLRLVLWLAAPLIQGEDLPTDDLRARLRLAGLVAMGGESNYDEVKAWLTEHQPELARQLARISVGGPVDR
ncbi:MAG TPA: hypothetical protein VHE35_03510 [Kofleriaceae bacterium]|nr:hypothetical protein [Kofleriaceae bacterium]